MTPLGQMARLDGLDLARFIALVGMVIVNFTIVMGAEGADSGLLGTLTAILEGRAAAMFVVLAGIGLGLAAKRSVHSKTVFVTIKEQAAYLKIAKRQLIAVHLRGECRALKWGSMAISEERDRSLDQ